MTGLRRPSPGQLVLAAAYAGNLALAVLTTSPSGSPLAWPSAGVAALWLSRRTAGTRRRGSAVAVTALGALTALLCGVPAVAAVAVGVGDALAALLVVALAERWQGGALRLRAPRDLRVLLVATALAAAASAALVLPALVLAGREVPLLAVATWSMRSAASLLAVLAVGLLLRQAHAAASAVRSPLPTRLVAVGAAVGSVLAVFGVGDGLQLTFAVLPFLVTAVLVLSSAGGALLLLACEAAVVVLTRAGHGPFDATAGLDGVRDLPPAAVEAMLVQAFLLVLTVVVLEVALHRDQRDALAAQALESRDLATAVMDAAVQQAVLATDPGGRITVFSSGAERMLGYRAAEVVGRSALLFHVPEEVAARTAELGVAGVAEALLHGVESGPATQRWTLVRRDGSRLQADVVITLLSDAGGTPRGSVGVITDVTARLAEGHRLAVAEERFRAAFEATPTGLMMLSLAPGTEGVMTQVNESFAAFVGTTASALLGTDVADVLHPDDLAAHWESLYGIAGGETPPPGGLELRFVTTDGRVRWGLASASVMHPADDGSERYLLAVVQDVTGRHDAEDALRHLAQHDALTGLANRSLLRERVTEAVSSDAGVTVLFIDLDGFKPVNDAHGHAAGDALLCEVARRLLLGVRAEDTVARLGGDEFAVVCPGLDEADLPELVARLRATVETPVVLPDGARTRVTASIGSSRADGTGGTDGLAPEVQVERLLAEADQRMYDVKRIGRAARDARATG